MPHLSSSLTVLLVTSILAAQTREQQAVVLEVGAMVATLTTAAVAALALGMAGAVQAGVVAAAQEATATSVGSQVGGAVMKVSGVMSGQCVRHAVAVCTWSIITASMHCPWHSVWQGQGVSVMCDQACTIDCYL
jgi:F0F1-type ATP synthase beta subunit